jgi:hypothetical protein
MDPVSDPTPDATPFFNDFKDVKKISYFFLITYPQYITVSLKLKNLIFAKILCQIVVFMAVSIPIILKVH